jgi:hypothetical protein
VLSLQVFIGSAFVPFFSKVTKRYREAQKVAAEGAAVADAAGKLEGGGDGGGSKRGLAPLSAAVTADGSSEGKEPPSSQPWSAEAGSTSLSAEGPHSPPNEQKQ